MSEADGKSQSRENVIRGLLGGPEYRRLFAAVRRRVERAGLESARSVSLPELSDSESRAVADLFGWLEVPDTPRIVLADLDAALRASRVGAGLVEVLEALGGPIVDQQVRRAELIAAESEMWSRARAHPGVRDRPAVERWLEELRSLGLLKRAAQTAECPPEELLTRALDVVERLPTPKILLSVLSAEACDDSHALDHKRPLAGLVLRAAAHLASWPSVPDGAPERRRLWSEVGVLCDPLSSQVLVLGLRPLGDGNLARRLRLAADAGEPQRITLRELAGRRIEVAPERAFVCENPSVVTAAADAHGAACAPLICLEGLPSTAALELLAGMRASRARLAVHADFDWAGIRIANLIMTRAGAEPWRLSVREYRAALGSGAAGPPLSDRSISAPWDPALEPAMREAGCAIYEEAVLSDLLDDLSASWH